MTVAPNGDEIGPERVWLKDQYKPGLAMSRSIGDDVCEMIKILSDFLWPKNKESNARGKESNTRRKEWNTRENSSIFAARWRTGWAL